MDVFLWIIAAITQALVGFLGFFLSLRPQIAERRFKECVGAFIALTILGTISAGWGAVRAAKSSGEIERLNQRILYETTGSPDGYLVIHLNFMGEGLSYDNGVVGVEYYNESEYPMIATELFVVGTRYLNFDFSHGWRIGDVLSKRGGKIPGLKFTLRKDVDQEIEFSIQARSVTVWERIVVTWNGKGWVEDYSLFKDAGEKKECEKGAGEKEVYLKKIRADFPFQDKKNKTDPWVENGS